MNTSSRKFAAITAIVAAGLLASFSASAAEGDAPAAKPDSPTCHQVTKRIAVWPHGPSKGLQFPRYETRTLTVCNQDRVKPSRTAAQSSFGPRYR